MVELRVCGVRIGGGADSQDLLRKNLSSYVFTDFDAIVDLKNVTGRSQDREDAGTVCSRRVLCRFVCAHFFLLN